MDFLISLHMDHRKTTVFSRRAMRLPHRARIESVLSQFGDRSLLALAVRLPHSEPMKPKTFLPSLCLMLLLLATVHARANLECLPAGQVTFSPMHPGPADQITFSVELFPGVAPTTSFQVLNKAIVTSGNNIEIDTVATDDASPFPGYVLSDPTSSVVTGLILSSGSLGPLAQGQYSVTASISTYDSATGTLGHLCGGPWYATVFVGRVP
ncbi:MAG: hypothetical protein ACRD3W_01615, partial [Terriglobales bacterium]